MEVTPLPNQTKNYLIGSKVKCGLLLMILSLLNGFSGLVFVKCKSRSDTLPSGSQDRHAFPFIPTLLHKPSRVLVHNDFFMSTFKLNAKSSQSYRNYKFFLLCLLRFVRLKKVGTTRRIYKFIWT